MAGHEGIGGERMEQEKQMIADINDIVSQLIVTAVVVSVGWLMKLRRDVNSAHEKIRNLDGKFHVEQKKVKK